MPEFRFTGTIDDKQDVKDQYYGVADFRLTESNETERRNLAANVPYTFSGALHQFVVYEIVSVGATSFFTYGGTNPVTGALAGSPGTGSIGFVLLDSQPKLFAIQGTLASGSLKVISNGTPMVQINPAHQNKFGSR